MSSIFVRGAAGLLLSFGLCSTNLLADDLLDRARLLMKGGQAESAYDLLSEQESVRAGEAEYDYLLGLAAIDAGRAAAATLALERVVAQDSRNAGARLDLGRAWFALGNLDRAEKEFLKLLELSPPEVARQAISQYLQAIEQRRASARTQWLTYVELGLGYDTNVNNSTDNETIYAPLFGVDMQLSATNIESEDGYGIFRLGGSLDHRLSDGLALFLSSRLDQRLNFDYSEFNTGSIAAQAGLQWSIDSDQLRLALDASHHRLDGDANRNSLSMIGEWRHPLASDQLLSLSAQLGTQRYASSDMESNDIDNGVFALTWMKSLEESGKTLFFANGYLGNEWERNLRADGDKRFAGVRVGMQQQWLESVTGNLSLGYQHGGYRRENAIFLTDRTDRMTDLRLGSVWAFMPDWSLTSQLGLTWNDSNIGIYAYDRADLSFTVRHQF